MQLEYDPAPPFDAGSPERAPAAAVAAVREHAALMGPAIAAAPQRAPAAKS